MNTPSGQVLSFEIPVEYAGRRMDQVLAELLDGYSRAQVQRFLRDGQARVDGASVRPRDKVRGGEAVTVHVPPAVERPWQAETIPLAVVYEDADLLVINKPPGLVVHPGAGNPGGTLLNALLHHAPELNTLARAGIVHRLDKETSGLMVVARNDATRLDLTEQLSARSLQREYLAVVTGVLVAGGTVDAPIGRHRADRTRMAVVHGGRAAVTHYRVETRYRAHTLIRVRLESGRTHQIRVHMAHQRHPVFGDPVYGGRLQIPPDSPAEFIEMLRGFRRQALHATRLGLVHPRSGEHCVWQAPPPDDMQALMDALAADVAAHSPAAGHG